MLVILLIDPQFSIDLQLIGGVIILQTLPAVALGLYTRWFHKWFDPTAIGLDARTTVYVGFIAVLANLVVAALVTLVCRSTKVADGVAAILDDLCCPNCTDHPRSVPPGAALPE